MKLVSAQVLLFLAAVISVGSYTVLSLIELSTPVTRSISNYTADADAAALSPKTGETRNIQVEPTRTPVVIPTGMLVARQPNIDVQTIRRVLQSYGSPAVNEAQAIFDLGVQYGIDPAFCLAFFIAESSAGTKGLARETKSVGNIRATPGYVNYKGYRKYATWREGIEDWYKLITRLYVGEWGLDTVEKIIPVYAPSSDGNDPKRYIETVRRLVEQWRISR